MEQTLWFFGGAVAYSFMAKLLNYTHMLYFVREMTFHILKLLGSVAEDVAFARALKYKALSDSDLEEEQIEKIKMIDEMAIKNWKTSIIYKMLECYPKKHRNLLPFYNWDGAMQTLTSLYEKERRNDRKNK